MQGIFAVYKPKGPTSHDIVQQVKRIAGDKVGHAGTLDPLASGVLVVGVGRDATKKLAEEVQKEKEYVAEIFLGATSTTDDEEGEKELFSGYSQPTRADIETILPTFIGEIQQVPPLYSAVKVSGQEAYKLARKGKMIQMGARSVTIKNIEMLDYNFPLLRVRVVTGPGVYIRSLARDVGQRLKCGGYLKNLERTRVGQFTLTDAITLEQLKSNVA